MVSVALQKTLLEEIGLVQSICPP